MAAQTNNSEPSLLQALKGGWINQPAGLKLYLKTIAWITGLTFLALLYYHYFSFGMSEAHLWTTGIDTFGDLFHYRPLFSQLHTEAFFLSADRFAYPAPCAVLFAFFYHFIHPHFVYDVVFLVTEIGSAFVFFRLLERWGFKRVEALLIASFLLLTSYPWHTLYDRANLEVFVWIFLATGVWAYVTGRHSLAAALWGCGAAMKIYPIVMLLVFAHRKNAKALLAGIATFAGVLLGSFWYVGPTISIAARGSLNGITGFVGNYAGTARIQELTIDHSILGGIKEILSVHMLHLGTEWSGLSHGYLLVVAIVGLIIYFRRVRKLPVWNQLSLFVIAAVLLPPVSYDYTLVHTYLVMGIVLGAYLFSVKQGVAFPGMKTYFVSLGVIATAQTWIQFQSLHLNGLIKCIALLSVAVLLLRFPLQMSLEDDTAG